MTTCRNVKSNHVFILGNGPSLREFDFYSLSGNVCVGMNAAFRHWHRINWYPTYYICMDTVMVETQKESIKELILKYNDRIKLFFIRKNILDFYPEINNNPHVLFLEDYLNSPYFEKLSKWCTTGSFATLFAAMLGYKKLFLLGIDLVFIEQIAESKHVNGHILKITKTPKHNPNYFFDDYQRKGDLYNIPNSTPNLHYKSWKLAGTRLEKFGVDVLNCSSVSTLDLFDYINPTTIERKNHKLKEMPLRKNIKRLLPDKPLPAKSLTQTPNSFKKCLIPKSIVFYGINPATGFSGGRYHVWLMAEAAAELGLRVSYITDNYPTFYADFENPSLFPANKKIKLYTIPICSDSCEFPDVPCDVFIVVPHNKCNGHFVKNALQFAMKKKARIGFLNFETPNWYNQLSPIKREANDWEGWKKLAKYSSVIFSSSAEGTKFAKEFYPIKNKNQSFCHCWPPVNTRVADMLPAYKKEKRIVLFVRFTASEHKGSNLIADIISKGMSGYTLVLIVGLGTEEKRFIESINKKAKKYNVSVKIKKQISEEQKWIELKRASLLIYPSFFEGFGLPPVEAQYVCTPCIAFDLPVLREISGDGIIYVPAGNLNELKSNIDRILETNSEWSHLKKNIESKVHFDSFTKRVNNLLKQIYRSKRIINENPLVDKSQKESEKKEVKPTHVHKNSVVYFPMFTRADDFTNHYHRACWYLPKLKHVLEHVLMGCESHFECGIRPSYMCPPRSGTNHIQQVNDTMVYSAALSTAKLILVWRPLSENESKELAKFGKESLNIDTNDPSVAEYGAYCRVHWTMMDQPMRNDLLKSSSLKFKDFSHKIQKKGYDSAVVFCTGPSIDQAFDFNFSNCFTHACNTTVRNKVLLNHILPDLISAGDVVSHFGISTYAEKFRNDLVAFLSTHDCYFLTSANYGNFFRIQYPEIENKILLCNQTLKEPNHNLLEKWALPCLSSVLNIHMLPAAATLFDHIFILGADGKNPDQSKNEDFWAHSKSSQYHDLVETGHKAHPTFNLNRQVDTFQKYLDSVKSTLEIGEKEKKKHYYSLAPSFTPGLSERYIKYDTLLKLKNWS